MKTTKETIRIAFEFEIKYSTPQGRVECVEMATKGEKDAARYGKFGVASVKISNKPGVLLTPTE